MSDDERKYRGGKIILVVIVLVLTFALGVAPLWDFVDARYGTYPVVGTVDCNHCHLGTDNGPVIPGGSGGTSVVFHLPDGTQHETRWRAWSPPDKGDKIHVAKDPVDTTNWLSKGSQSWLHAIRGAVVLLIGLALVVWLLAPRRSRSRINPTEATAPKLYKES